MPRRPDRTAVAGPVLGAVLGAALAMLPAADAAAQGKPVAPAADAVPALGESAFAPLLDELGYGYTMAPLPDATPRLRVTTGGDLPVDDFVIVLGRCRGDACGDALLSGLFRPPAPVPVATINTWNRDRRWTKAYLDADGLPVIEMDLLADGGIGQDALRILFLTFVEEMRAFAREVGAAS